MKKITLLITLVVIFSCNKKVVELPEISHSEITEIEDVSAAYLFYVETQPDSVALNRKNLISTTNWLVNVDKRLTLKQAIPHIKYLQDKKANAGHKNENAKNYFTCHDTSINNLGFMEFTDVVYSESSFSKFTENILPKKPVLILQIEQDGKIHVFDLFAHKISNIGIIDIENSDEFKNINSVIKTYSEVILKFNSKLNFQNYISIKSKLLGLDIENVIISENEFIY
ncbi:hypothetical protein N1F78_10860 [Seonamhaeicola sp. MEBiC1930]|uniref:hypothetical protein n=1 Tax=Seonamhaeicola sp. MEBiC01930 TaxID=2976768 RepID=UPI00324B9CF8